jgi:hypothetical protein
VNGTSINATKHFVVACDTTDCDVMVASGGASASVRVASVRPSADWSGRTIASRTGVRFDRDYVSRIRLADPPVFSNALAEPGSIARGSGFAGRIASHQVPALAGNHNRIDRRRLEFGLDLLSLLGNPHRIVKDLFNQTDPRTA